MIALLPARMAEAGLTPIGTAPETGMRRRRRRAMSRILLVLIMLAATAGAVVAYGDPEQIARAGDQVSRMLRQQTLAPAPAVQIQRGNGGEFALRAKINGVSAPMVIDHRQVLQWC